MFNYRGLKRIQFIYHGDWSDPELIYKKRSFDYYNIEDLLYNEFKAIEEKEDPTDEEFDKWIGNNKSYIYNLIKDIYF